MATYRCRILATSSEMGISVSCRNLLRSERTRREMRNGRARIPVLKPQRRPIVRDFVSDHRAPAKVVQVRPLLQIQPRVGTGPFRRQKVVDSKRGARQVGDVTRVGIAVRVAGYAIFPNGQRDGASRQKV